MAAPRAADQPPPPSSSRSGDSVSALRFLQGGGEMGGRMRALDWTRTPLGPAPAWPQSLKTIVRVMLDSRYAMWMLWGPQMTFFCNDAYAPTLGIKRDWALGSRSDQVWKEIWPDVRSRIERVLIQGEATWDEGLLLFLERSGFLEETYHTFSYSPVYDDDNRVAGMLCVVTEVTERVIGERRLRVLRDLAARAAGVESVADSCRGASEVLSQYPYDVPFAAIYLVQSEPRQATRVACTGAAATSALPDVLEVDATGSGTWPIAQLLATESAQHMARLPAAGVAISAGPWPDLVQDALLLPLKGAGVGLVGFIVAGCSPRHALDQDYRSFLELVAGQVASAIADAQAYETERRRAEALAELDRAKTAFFSNVSHEFRTPLTLLLGPLEEALASEGVAPPLRERIELAQRNATRLQRLVNALLDFSRIEAGRARATFEPTDLPALTRDLASTFRSAMDKAGLEFVVDAPPAAEPVYVDREMWEKIVLNLLSNAFKFTLAGSVRVALRVQDGAAQLVVTDTGTGIPAHELPRLFERFHRVEGAHGRTHEGSGIGLALVLELVKLHGGTIGATSTFGTGTTFTIRLPLGSSHLPAEHVRRPRAATADTGVARSFVEEALRWLPDPAGTSEPMALLGVDAVAPGDRRFAATFGARIVLADDNADMRAYLRELLAPYYRVETVADGAAALAAARRAPPDLILSDVMMPRLDGFQLLAAVRADAALASVAVVLLSARAGEEARIEGLDSGADDYVVKPFSARELLARIGSLLELRRVRAQTESALRYRAAQFVALLHDAPLGVFLVDADFRIREANPTAREAFGPELEGADFEAVNRRLWSADQATEIVRIFRHTLATGEAYFVPERIERRLDLGVVEYYEWQVNRIPLPDGRFGVVCYFRDISAHVRARLQLEEADRQKDEFLAMLAHELRNPLAPIRNAGEILARLSSGDPRAQVAVGIVQRQILALTRLVDDLLDVSRITQGRIELQLRIIQLADVVAQAVEIVDPLLQERHHELRTTSHGQLRVHGDLARLVQCVANVLTNAAKYTDRGGRIQLEVRDDGGEAVISVTDNGIGIPPELQPKVFDLFVQGDRALDRAQGGLGIGLSVVKRLVDMHGGTVCVASEGAGRGSRFEIRLPTLAKDVVADDRPPVPKQPARRVLIVDDNVDAADSLTMILRLDGHEVECAYTAREGLAEAIRFRPDAAFLDIGLPGMDGYELAARMREDPQLAGTYLVALTGYGQAEDKLRARQFGFDAHLVKPADLRALQEILASIRRSRPRQLG